jgi:nucleotide-binding universal stress UspA family protein
MGTGSVIIGYDGSPAAERALGEVADLLPGRSALVVTVWEPGAAYTLVDPMMVPAPIDVRLAQEVDEALYEQARRLAEQGASRLRGLGLDAEALTVADELTIPETLIRLARERDAAVVVVGAHGHSRVREVLLGSTAQTVVRKAACPVLVVRGGAEED